MQLRGISFVVVLVGLVSFSKVFAQGNCSYVVVSTGTYTIGQIDAAFGGANLDAYRKKTVRRQMLFTNGAEVHLLSASEMQTNNCLVNGMLAMDDNTPIDPDRRFEIHPSGAIVEPIQATYKR